MRRLFDLLNEGGLQYAVLHGWQSLPARVSSDLDLVITRREPALFEQLLLNNDFGARIVQMTEYATTGLRFDVCVPVNGHVEWLPIDVTTDYRSGGLVFLTSHELSGERRRWNGLWIAGPRVEFTYLIVKKILKGLVPDHQKQRLRELAMALDRNEAHALTRRLFGPTWGSRVYRWIMAGQWDELENHFSALNRASRRQALKRDPLNPLRYWFPELGRVWRRCVRPTGLFVAVLGSDGAGKSTLIAGLRTALANAFRGAAAFHLFPGVLRRKGTPWPVTDPHGRPPRPLGLSLLKPPYYLAEYALGYLCKVRPRLMRTAIVLFDRYYDDLLVDPRRYRYGGPPWLARVVQKVIPPPDLLFVLDVPEDHLIARKQEVTESELRRQRTAYRQLAAERPNAVLLDGSLPPEGVTRIARDVVLNYLHDRYLKRRHLVFGNDGSETLRWLESVLFIPGTGRVARSSEGLGGPKQAFRVQGAYGWITTIDGRGYLIPFGAVRAGISALGLYNAQHLKARLAKGLLRIGLYCGVAGLFMRTVHVSIRTDLSEDSGSQRSLLEHLKRVVERQDVDFAVSAGPRGPHRKPVLQILSRDGAVLGYTKVGWDETSNRLVLNEAATLERLATSALKSVVIPKVLHKGWWNGRFFCVLSAADGHVEQGSRNMTAQQVSVLQELADVHARWMTLPESRFMKDLHARIETISNAYYRHILEQGIRAVDGRLRNTRVPFHLRHGDFAPWNILTVTGRLLLFDWEYSDSEAPPGWDVFHFGVQTMWLLKGMAPGPICEAFEPGGAYAPWVLAYGERLGLDPTLTQPFFLLYLLDRLAFYAAHEPTNFTTLRCLAMKVSLVTVSIHEGRSETDRARQR